MPTFFDGELVFVHIPKCAGTSIRNALVKYQHELAPIWSDDFSFYRLHESLFEIQTPFIEKWGAEKWERVPVIATFRHPIERIVSWWKFIKEANNHNFHKWCEHRDSNLETRLLGFDAITSVQPWIAPEDYAMYHRKNYFCQHETDKIFVDEFSALSFHDYVSRMTVWKKSGCNHPGCPYHMLPPQICWLYEVGGQLRMNNLNLFLADRLDELERFLPGIGSMSFDNVTKKKDEDYRDYLTNESLLLLNKFYIEDFKLYETLKNMPGHPRTPLHFSIHDKKKKD